MVSINERRFYIKVVSVFILLGMILYGGLAIFARFPYAFLYVLLGGIFLGGIASGIILFSRYMKQQKSKTLKILSYVFFPITFSIIINIGVVLLVPYYISNFIIYVRTKSCTEPQRIAEIHSKTNKTINYVYVCLIAVMVFSYFVYSIFNETTISDDINTNTGYVAGSPEHVIFKDYYYDGINTDYNAIRDYSYKIKDNTLLILANKDGICYSNILFEKADGKYPDNIEYLKSGDFYGSFLRKDIDELFTNVRMANNGDNHAFMLIIDTRSIQQQIKQIKETWVNLDEQNAAIFMDSTHADIDKIQLFDEKGTSIKTMAVGQGKYIAYYDSFKSDNTDYKVIVTYEGEEVGLLTYDDIVNCNILVTD